MAWVKVDDRFPEHPKILGLSDAAFRLHIHALCYANGHLTDGFLPLVWLTGGRGRMVPKAVTQLVTAGIWEAVEGGWQIHDYLEYQQSRETVLANREQTHQARVEAGRLGGLAKAANAKQAPSKPLANANSKTLAPSPPLPSPSTDTSKNEVSVAHPIRVLLAEHERLFVERYRHRPAKYTGKDAQHAKALIDAHGQERALLVLAAFFASRDPFIAGSGHGLGVLSSGTVQNKVIAEMSGRKPLNDGRDWAREFIREG